MSFKSSTLHTGRISMKRLDLAGKRFGRLQVIGFCKMINTHSFFTCRCDCGTEKIVSGYSMSKPNGVKSCGCLTLEANQNKKNLHRKIHTVEYHTWRGIKERCYNKNSTGYSYYGGRGIKMSDEWRHSFVTFLKDMGERPEGGYSIDRINNNGDYCKENCRWATWKEQASNRRPREEWKKRTPPLTKNY